MSGKDALTQTFSKSASQNEHNDTQHHTLTSTFTISVSKSAIFALDFTFRSEILHDVYGITSWTTYSESAFQDQQNEYFHWSSFVILRQNSVAHAKMTPYLFVESAALNVPILQSEFPLNRENPNVSR